MQLENYKIFAEAYSTFDAEPLINALAEDCVFESQMVMQPLVGKPAIEEYLRRKMETFRKHKTHIDCSLAQVGSSPVLSANGSPCVVMRQGDGGAVVLLKQSEAGEITRIDLCTSPAPEDTRPLETD